MTQDAPQNLPPRAKGVLRTRHYFTPQPLYEEDGEEPTRGRVQAKRKPVDLSSHTLQASVRGYTLKFEIGAGVFSKDELDAGSRLLIETIEFAAAARLCDLGCGWGAVGCFAARLAPDARIWMCDINFQAVGLTNLTIWNNQLRNATAWCGDGLSAVGAANFDAVFCNPPVRAGNAVIARLFDDARRCLRTGGVLWVVLRTAQGAKSWQRKLADQFSNCETIAIKGGYRILKCVKV